MPVTLRQIRRLGLSDMGDVASAFQFTQRATQDALDALERGAIGATGATGATGPTGPTGPTGATGPSASLAMGTLASIPAANSVAVGSQYTPTDDPYLYISDGTKWYLKQPYAPPVVPPGDLSGWTYESGLTAAASMVNHSGMYSTVHALTVNTAPDYIDFLPPSPNIVTGAGGIWTVTACVRYAGVALAGAVTLFQGVMIVLKDGSGHRFMFGPQLTDSFLANASACGFTNHTRNYTSNLYSKEFSDIAPLIYTYFVRLRFDGANYISEYSNDGLSWHISTNGGTNIFDYGGGNAITPTQWGIGMQYVPSGLCDWDILHLSQTPTNG